MTGKIDERKLPEDVRKTLASFDEKAEPIFLRGMDRYPLDMAVFDMTGESLPTTPKTNFMYNARRLRRNFIYCLTGDAPLYSDNPHRTSIDNTWLPDMLTVKATRQYSSGKGYRGRK